MVPFDAGGDRIIITTPSTVLVSTMAMHQARMAMDQAGTDPRAADSGVLRI